MMGCKRDDEGQLSTTPRSIKAKVDQSPTDSQRVSRSFTGEVAASRAAPPDDDVRPSVRRITAPDRDTIQRSHPGRPARPGHHRHAMTQQLTPPTFSLLNVQDIRDSYKSGVHRHQKRTQICSRTPVPAV